MSLWLWGVLHPHVLLRRAIAAVYSAEFARQRVGELEDRLRGQLHGIEEGIRALIRQNEHQAGEIRAMGERIDASSERVDNLLTKLAPLPRRMGALATEVATLAEDFRTKTKSLDAQVAAVRAEIMFQQRRVTRLVLPDAAKPAALVATETVDQRIDSLYAAFEDVFRGTREDIKGRLEIYLDPLRLAGAGQQDKPILDVGCGRGEWLELLSENGLRAYGIDISTIMVERSVSYGLDARHADVLGHLHGTRGRRPQRVDRVPCGRASALRHAGRFS